MSGENNRDFWILRATYLVLFAYNAIFFFGKYIYFQGTLVRLHEFIDRYIVFFTILEFMGIASVFIDLITDWEKKPAWRRAITLILAILIVTAFIFKLFINWMHSSLLPPT